MTIWGITLLGAGLLWGLPAAGFAAPNDGIEWALEGKRAFQQGAFSLAAANWERAAATFRAAGEIDKEVATTVDLAAACQGLGQQRRAVQLLEGALKAAEAKAPGLKNAVQGRLGVALTLTRDYDRAGVLLQETYNAARADGDLRLAGAVRNDQGNLLAARQLTSEAMIAYAESAGLARESGDRTLLAQALCNGAGAAARSGNEPAAFEMNGQALAEIEALDTGYGKAFLLMTSAETDRRLGTSGEARLRAHRSLTAALRIGEELSDLRTQTYALGALGRLYEEDGQLEHAMGLTRRAIAAAQQGQVPESLYRWEWQIGRQLKAGGDTEAALAAYRRAVLTLKSIRSDVTLGSGNDVGRGPFRETEGPLFFELADLILRRAAVTTDVAQEQAFLREARDTVEQLKAVELEDYLCDDCVDALRAKTRAVESVDSHTAVIYFVLLPDRTETLVGLTSGLRRFTVGLNAQELTAEAREFRRNLETRTSYGYLEQAQELYARLIRPLDELLRTNEIKTLVFVPDGALRTIPFGALHDGERFLIQNFAVAVVPGLSLVEPRSITRDRARLLLGGVSDSVQGFPPLYFVSTELETIAPMYRSETLLNDTFTLHRLQKRLEEEQFSIVHLASHGQFDRDVRNTFVLTHDGKLTLNALEAVIRPAQYRGRPVELLVLSACQTAAGDDRAALGLAGVAVKAGARSALATLWFVNDQSTSLLVTEVYEQLRRTPGLSKAAALQAAQVKLLGDRRYRHPCYWSPYLMIGDWL